MNKKTLRTIGILCLLCLLTGAVIGYRMYNKPHRSAASETAIPISATQLAADYGKDETKANSKYLGKAIQVSGTVSDVSLNQQQKSVIVLTGSDMNGVQCTLLEAAPGIRTGDRISIKGFCAGFLTDVILDQCVLVH